MVASKVQLTGLKQVVTPQQIQNLFLLYRTGSKPAGDKFFLSEHTLTFTRGWFPQRFLLIDLSEVVNPTESKSVSLGLCRFEICLTIRLFLVRTHLDIHSWMVSSEVHLTRLNQVVTTTESKSVSLGVGSKPADNIFAVYRSSEILSD